MAGPESGIVSRLLVDVVQVAVDEELDPSVFQSEFVGSDGPEQFPLFPDIEPVEIDEGSITTLVRVPKVRLVGEAAFEKLNVPQGQQRLCPCRRAVSG